MRYIEQRSFALLLRMLAGLFCIGVLTNACALESGTQTLGDAVAAIAQHGRLDDVDFTAEALGGVSFHLNDANACEHCERSVEQLVPDRAPAGGLVDHFEYVRESAPLEPGHATIELIVAVEGCVDPNRLGAKAGAVETFVSPGMWPIGWVRSYTTQGPTPITIGFTKSAGVCVLSLQQSIETQFHGAIELHPAQLDADTVIARLIKLSQLSRLSDVAAVSTALGARLHQSRTMVRDPASGSVHEVNADMVFLEVPLGLLPDTLEYVLLNDRGTQVSLSADPDPSRVCVAETALRRALRAHGFATAEKPYPKGTLRRHSNALTFEMNAGRCVTRFYIFQDLPGQ